MSVLPGPPGLSQMLEKGHGTFLDAGELHQVVTFIVQGGLDRARAEDPTSDA